MRPPFAVVNATSSEHILNPQSPRRKRESFCYISSLNPVAMDVWLRRIWGSPNLTNQHLFLPMSGLKDPEWLAGKNGRMSCFLQTATATTTTQRCHYNYTHANILPYRTIITLDNAHHFTLHDLKHGTNYSTLH